MDAPSVVKSCQSSTLGSEKEAVQSLGMIAKRGVQLSMATVRLLDLPARSLIDCASLETLQRQSQGAVKLSSECSA